MAHMQLTPKVRMDIGFYNLTDKTYIRWANAPTIGSDAQARFTQPDFNTRITLRVKF